MQVLKVMILKGFRSFPWARFLVHKNSLMDEREIIKKKEVLLQKQIQFPIHETRPRHLSGRVCFSAKLSPILKSLQEVQMKAILLSAG